MVVKREDHYFVIVVDAVSGGATPFATRQTGSGCEPAWNAA